MAIKDEILDQLMRGYEKPEDLLGKDGLFMELKKALVERALAEELTHHLGYEEGEKSGRDDGDTRNGHGKKKVKTSSGEMELAIPRDRLGGFEPQLIKKGQRHFEGFDDKIISMYARGMSTREIQGHLKELYGVEVSPDLVSRVTEGIIQEVNEWRNRPLDALYPLVIFDALQVKIRDEGTVRNKAVYLALGMNTEGIKEVLGLWIEQTEGAKFWLRVMTELKNRGVQDILIAAVDGLKAIYKAQNAEAAEDHLVEFERKWDAKYPTIGQSWKRNWEQIIPFLAYPMEIRKVIYTTNAIESLNSTLRKAVKARGHFPSDQAATKLLYLAIKNLTAKWKKPPREWTMAMNQFAILFDDRLKAVEY